MDLWATVQTMDVLDASSFFLVGVITVGLRGITGHLGICPITWKRVGSLRIVNLKIKECQWNLKVELNIQY